MNIKVFNKLLREELENLGFKVNEDDHTILAVNSDVEVEVNLEILYSEFMNIDDEKILCDNILNKIQNQIKKSRILVDLNKVSPTLKKKGYGLEIEPNLIRDNFSYDLDLLYVQEEGEILQFLLESDNSQAIREHALKNLENNFIVPVLENIGLCLYKYPFPSYLNSAMLLLDKTREFLLKKIGEKVLVVVPNEAFVVFAPDNASAEIYLKQFMDMLINEKDNISISDQVYRWDLIHNNLTNINIKSSLKIINH